MRISVIIPNYNGIGILRNCLNSLLQHDRRPDQIIVVDNGSSDGSTSSVRKEYPSVTLVPLDSNTGFTGANNHGLDAADGDALVLLNNDCVVEPEWLRNLENRLSETGVAAVTSSMRNINDLKIMDSAGGEIDWMCFSRDQGKGAAASCFSDPMNLPFPSGGAVIVRRAALPDPSVLFWNDLFLYQEDLDLGFELLRTGWKVVYEPAAVVRHMHSATAGRGSYLKEYYCIRNRLLVMRKHFDTETFSRLLPTVKKWQRLWAARSLIRGRTLLVKAILKGTSDGLSMPVPGFNGSVSLNAVFKQYARKFEPCGRTKLKLYGRAEKAVRSS